VRTIRCEYYLPVRIPTARIQRLTGCDLLIAKSQRVPSHLQLCYVRRPCRRLCRASNRSPRARSRCRGRRRRADRHRGGALAAAALRRRPGQPRAQIWAPDHVFGGIRLFHMLCVRSRPGQCGPWQAALCALTRISRAAARGAHSSSDGLLFRFAAALALAAALGGLGLALGAARALFAALSSSWTASHSLAEYDAPPSLQASHGMDWWRARQAGCDMRRRSLHT